VDFGAGFRGSVLLFFAGFLILDLLGSDAWQLLLARQNIEYSGLVMMFWWCSLPMEIIWMWLSHFCVFTDCWHRLLWCQHQVSAFCLFYFPRHCSPECLCGFGVSSIHNDCGWNVKWLCRFSSWSDNNRQHQYLFLPTLRTVICIFMLTTVRQQNSLINPACVIHFIESLNCHACSSTHSMHGLVCLAIAIGALRLSILLLATQPPTTMYQYCVITTCTHNF
jgi:hypothetical protein